jgi:hypothetical protein
LIIKFKFNFRLSLNDIFIHFYWDFMQEHVLRSLGDEFSPFAFLFIVIYQRADKKCVECQVDWFIEINRGYN